MRPLPLLGLAGLLAAAPAAEAQVVYVRFKSESIAKRYKKNLSRFRGFDVLIGEPKEGLSCLPDQVSYTSGPEAKNSLYVADPARPERVPYQWVDGGRRNTGHGSVVSFAGNDVEWIGYVDRLQTLAGLSAEYSGRLEEVEALRERRDDCAKASREWFVAHAQRVTLLDRLVSWLQNNGFPDAARQWQKDLIKEKKTIGGQAAAQREQEALASIHPVATPPELVQAAQDLTGGAETFHVQESRHLRICHAAGLADAQATALLELGERVIESFRREFVDPHLSEDFPDWIPEGPFAEFWFGPPDDVHYERFLEDYYGLAWGKPKEKHLQAQGSRHRQSKGPRFLHYWRLSDKVDLEGTIVHGLGHNLASLHYNRGQPDTPQPWIEEAVGYYLSFGFLGRNSVVCFAWSEATYGKAAVKEGEKTVQAGLRGFFNELALQKGPPVEALALKSLAEISDADFAKAWSFFDFLARTEGRRGQEWLRASCAAARKGRGFMDAWRALSEETFEVSGEDVFAVLERRWQEFAATAQSRE